MDGEKIDLDSIKPIITDMEGDRDAGYEGDKFALLAFHCRCCTDANVPISLPSGRFQRPLEESD
jgi:hypothetical protein